MKSASRPQEKQRKAWLIVFIIAILGVLLIPFFLPETDRHKTAGKDEHGHDASVHKSGKGQVTKKNFSARIQRPGEPKGEFQYVFDRSPNGDGFLISKKISKDFLPESEQMGGRDLWIQDANGKERLVAENVYRARFSPDGSKIAYGTSDSTIKVETLNGERLANVDRALEPSWKPDSSGFAYTRVPEGRPLNLPEVLQISTYDLNSGQIKHLTDGQWDDVRPDFHPSGEFVVFVSGARSGIASFWKVPVNGGEPVQITNLGLEQVNDLFVPPPYDRTMWTKDKRWFVYDFKSGDTEQTWGLEFDAQGNYKGATKLGDGIDPRLNEDGQTVSSVLHTETNAEKVDYQIPASAVAQK